MNAPVQRNADIDTVRLAESVGGWPLSAGPATQDRNFSLSNIAQVRESILGGMLHVVMLDTAPGTFGNESAVRDMICPSGQGLRKRLEQSGAFSCTVNWLGRETWTQNLQNNNAAINALALKHQPQQNFAEIPKGNRNAIRLGFNRFAKHCG